MPLYENVFITRQDISVQQAENLSDQFAAAITDHGGKVTKREYWGLRNLSYRIKKSRKGHYTLFNLDTPIEAIQEMERQMRLNEDVLRHLTVRVEELEDGPSIVMTSRSARDERGGRGGRRGRDGPPRDAGARSREDGREAKKPAETEGGGEAKKPVETEGGGDKA